MRRTPRFRAVTLAIGMLLATPGLAVAQPGSPDALGALVAAVATANQKLQDLGAAIQAQQEGVNKAIVDVQTARDNAAAAQQEVDASAQRVTEANTAISAAQQRFDTFAAATYVNGPSVSYLTASDPADILSTAAAGQTLSVSSQQVVTDLLRARTEQVNIQSAARLAKQNADKAVADAEASQQSAVSALTQAQQTFGAQQAELDRLTAERAAAQAKLDAARNWSAPAGAPPAARPAAAPTGDAAANWDRTPATRAAGTKNWDTAWDPTLPAIPSAFVSGDPIAIINTILGIAQTSAQVTQQMGRNFLQKLGLISTPTGYTNGAIPRVYGRQATEYVIRRGVSQLGVPYSWGGGNAAGPSRGVDSGAGTVGFDCSGLMLFMFAGVGIKLDHYSGSQYNAGRKVPSSQMRRGDMIFYGPNASQHVAMYLGDGQMLEAPYTGSTVKVSPVRTSGMTPYVTRLIEW
jgi:cell wall-associated NlpC family hydrolase